MSLASRVSDFSTRVATELKSVRTSLANKVDLTDPRLTDSRAPTAHNHVVSNVTDFRAGVGSTLGVYPVSVYGTVDGVDDQVQINAAIDAASAARGGGIVWLDSPTYVCSAPIVPKSGVTFYGSHTPRYEPSGAVTSACRIEPAASFTGEGLIQPGAGARGVRFHQVALYGGGRTNSIGQPIHGIRMPAQENVTGEQGWHLDSVTIASFTGSGIYGSTWVWSILNLFVHNNQRYGIETNGGTTDRWVDVKANNVWCFFNRLSGVAFLGGMSGGVQWVNCRFERSGQVHGNPENSPVSPNWNEAAAGFLLRRGQFISFTNCSTDANNGNGWDMYGSPADINNISFTSCIAKRDGGGDQVNLPDRAGFLVGGADSFAGTQNISFVNCATIPGKSKDSDASAGAVTAPANGLLFINALQTRWQGPPPSGSLSPYTFYGDNYGCGILLMQDDGALQYVKDGASPITLGESGGGVDLVALDARYINSDEEIGDTSLPGRLDSGARAVADFNNMDAAGFYRTDNSGTVLNKPPTGGDYWMVFVESYGGSGDLTQTAHNWGANALSYRRHKQSGAWQSWEQILVRTAETDARYYTQSSSDARYQVVVVHNGTAYPSRPAGASYVVWKGPTDPAAQSGLDVRANDEWSPTA